MSCFGMRKLVNRDLADSAVLFPYLLDLLNELKN